MKTLAELAKECSEHYQKAASLRDYLQDHYYDEILERFKRVCAILSKNRKIERFYDDWGIENAVADLSLQDIKDKKYPASELEWNVEGNNFEIIIRAIFRSEIDNSTRVTFPIDPDAFGVYVRKLTKEADERLIKMQLEEQKQKDLESTEERELLEKLKAKYESQIN